MQDTKIDIEGIKARQKIAWMAGDFGEIAKTVDSHARDFIASCNLTSGMRVLDVACGSGNAALHAARAGAQVTGVDFAANLVAQARVRAGKEGIRAQFDVGDAEALPYPEASFDFVVTMYGAMFAPRPEVVASELLRVCKKGGKVAMANWTPDSFSGKMFKVMSTHVPPPAGLPAPVLWGDEATVQTRFRAGAASLRTRRVTVQMSFPFSVPDTVEHFRKFFGPTQRAFASLDLPGQHALRHDMEALYEQHNRNGDGATHVESEYLEVVVTKA
jgi:SAM-dependent methyltransferase